MYNGYHTSYDVMKEFLITGAELEGRYQIPKIPPCHLDYFPEDSVDFGESFSRKIRNHRNMNVNFYVDDAVFLRLWNYPDRYIQHLKCFHSVCAPDFSIATGYSGMPFPLNIYNKYRNHALAWYLHLNGIKIIPSVSILDRNNWDWGFDGYPKNSVVSVCTNGRIKSKDSRIEFCEGFSEMCNRLSPSWVILIGRVPEELKTEAAILNFNTRNQKINEKFKKGERDGNIYRKIPTKKETPATATG